MVPFTATLNGWALHKLWAWFIVPPLGVSPLSIPEAIGVSLIASYVTWFHVDAKADDSITGKEKIVVSIVGAVARPLVAVFFGWIVRGFI